MSDSPRGAMLTPIERLPPEVKVHIMGHIIDPKSLLHLLLASRSYKDTFKVNETAVAKGIARNAIPGQFKLAIMAEASANVDYRKGSEVLEFWQQYVKSPEWPLSYYNIRLVTKACQVDEAIRSLSSHVRCQGFEDFGLGSSTLTHTEKQRVRRVLYICAIASNLFPLGVILNPRWLETEHPHLCRLFWTSVPAWDVRRIEHMLSSDGILMSRSMALKIANTVGKATLRAAEHAAGYRLGSNLFGMYDSSLLQAIFLSSGLDAWTGFSDTQCEMVCDAVEPVLQRPLSMRGCYYGLDLTFTKRLYYEAEEAVILQPLPKSNPFYEPDTGIEDLYYTMDQRIVGKRMRTELIRLVGIEPDFLTRHRWALGIMDRTRLPRIPSQTELKGVPIIDPTEEQ
ncbi:hypothetical protein F4859DRAFT_524453 [Xylaria cf. heliscus]|nr:hypothetical protein F4859DRAFT_524453 [Xylaria cf. heliscus]